MASLRGVDVRELAHVELVIVLAPIGGLNQGYDQCQEGRDTRNDRLLSDDRPPEMKSHRQTKEDNFVSALSRLLNSQRSSTTEQYD